MWNITSIQAALEQLKTQGEKINDENIAWLSPLSHGDVNIPGHYTFMLAKQVTKGHLRPLKQASAQEEVVEREFSFR